MFLWKVLLNPIGYAQEIAAHPPLGAVTWLLLLLAVLLAVLTVGLSDLLIEHKHGRDFRSQFRLWSAGLAIPLLFLGLGLAFTFVMFGIERGLGHTLSFEAIFCLLVIGFTPKFAVLLAYSVREISRTAFYLWRIFACLILLYTTQRLWGAVSAANHLTVWHTLLTTAPLLIGLWVTSFWELREEPDSLGALFPWRRARSKRVTIFYPPGKAEADAKAMAWEADALVVQIEQLLNVKPVPFRIGIFLCVGPEDLRRLNKIKGTLSDGYASVDHISLVYGAWQDKKAIVAHELTHIVAKQRLSMHLLPLLNEGLAEYGMAQMVAGSTRAAICLPLSLGTLAHSGLFYEWLYVETPDFQPGAKYAHAAALVDYLIGRYGMEKFKELCQQTAYDAGENQAAQLHKAVTAIYSLSLQNLEQNWRREWIAPGQIERDPDLPDPR